MTGKGSGTSNRRDVLRGLAAAAIGAGANAGAALGGGGGSAAARSVPGAGVGSGLRKALKIGMVRGGETVADKFRILKEAGFEGVDMDSPTTLSREEVLRARDETGVVIHGVVDSVHWRDTLSDPDPEVQARGREALRRAIEDCEAWGGTTVLLVPAVVNKRVSYADAYERSRRNIREVLPHAEDRGIKIAIENVWNNFLLSPLEAARYLDEFESPMIGAYFDIGNVVKFGWPEHWIPVLGKRILKLDVKEYSHKTQFDAPLGEGDVDWAAVRAAIADVGYSGYCTAEMRGGDLDHLRDLAARMDRVLGIAGA